MLEPSGIRSGEVVYSRLISSHTFATHLSHHSALCCLPCMTTLWHIVTWVVCDINWLLCNMVKHAISNSYTACYIGQNPWLVFSPDTSMLQHHKQGKSQNNLTSADLYFSASADDEFSSLNQRFIAWLDPPAVFEPEMVLAMKHSKVCIDLVSKEKFSLTFDIQQDERRMVEFNAIYRDECSKSTFGEFHNFATARGGWFGHI